MPEILQIDEDKIQSFVNSYDKLQKFAFDLKLINEKRPHILDAETEKLLQKRRTRYQRHQMYTVCLATLI